MSRNHVDAKLRNEIADAFAKALKERPHDFSLDDGQYFLIDKKQDLYYWVANGMTFLSVCNRRHGTEILLGSGLELFPIWWPFAGFKAYFAFRKWKKRYHRDVDDPNVRDIIDKIRTDS